MRGERQATSMHCQPVRTGTGWLPLLHVSTVSASGERSVTARRPCLAPVPTCGRCGQTCSLHPRAPCSEAPALKNSRFCFFRRREVHASPCLLPIHRPPIGTDLGDVGLVTPSQLPPCAPGMNLWTPSRGVQPPPATHRMSYQLAVATVAATGGLSVSLRASEHPNRRLPFLSRSPLRSGTGEARTRNLPSVSGGYRQAAEAPQVLVWKVRWRETDQTRSAAGRRRSVWHPADEEPHDSRPPIVRPVPRWPRCAVWWALQP